MQERGLQAKFDRCLILMFAFSLRWCPAHNSSTQSFCLVYHIPIIIFKTLSLFMSTSTDSIIHASDSSFDMDVLKSDLPVLVDFWAEWCGPCKMIAPVLSHLAVEYAGRLKVVKVDVDSNPETATRYRIRGIPTLIFFKAGEQTDMKVGAVNRQELKSFVDTQLA